MVRTRLRVRFPGDPSAPDSGWGYSVIDFYVDRGSWVRTQRARGRKVPAALLPALLIELGLVEPQVSTWGSETKVSVAVPERFRNRWTAFTGRTGYSGAFKGHCWEVDSDGHRARPLAFVHRTASGALGAAWGVPAILFRMALDFPGAAAYINAARQGLLWAQVEEPLQAREWHWMDESIQCFVPAWMGLPEGLLTQTLDLPHFGKIEEGVKAFKALGLEADDLEEVVPPPPAPESGS